MTPPSEPIANARIDSHSVIARCFQITPLANQSKIWLPTSTGLEKKNGGSHMRPNSGTVASNCHNPSATTATSNCKTRSVKRDTATIHFSSSRPRPGPITTGLGRCAKAVERRLSKQSTRRMGPGLRRDDVGARLLWLLSASRLGERPDQTGRLLGVAIQRLDQLFAAQAGRK